MSVSGRKRLVILGATGSIGRQTRDLVIDAPGSFEVEAVAGGKDAAALASIARQLNARHAVISDDSAYRDLKRHLEGTSVAAAAGETAVCEAAAMPSDLVIAGIAGTAGVRPTHAAVAAGRTVALANKESLVCAGQAVMATAARSGAHMLPLDSEHNAIFQALGSCDAGDVETMTLTASGGPFREWDKTRIENASTKEALAHPNWSMGPKVTVDSAGLMNKGLELIEAHYLFAIEPARLAVLVHPQSIVHGLVAFRDGSVTAGLACPDMRVPIAHCLAWPGRLETRAPRLDLARIGALTFAKPDLERFPALGLAMEALAGGGNLPCVLNAANEAAVAAFLDGRISFGEIARTVRRALDVLGDTAAAAPTIEEALAVNNVARDWTARHLAR
jgi:1-deoxy-D-xylulose-5-phosphate reductoisomerase